MTLVNAAAGLAAATLVLPAAIALRWLVRPPHGRTRRGPTLVLATTMFGFGGQIFTITGVPAAAAFVRLVGTVIFALMCLELLNRQPRTPQRP